MIDAFKGKVKSAVKGKQGLKIKEVDPQHFSATTKSKLDDNDITKVVVTLLDGKNLLASDVETGKSDPVGFIWCGYNVENSPNIPNWENYWDENEGITLTKTAKTTCDPIWNEDKEFPLQINSIDNLFLLRICILIRDEDEVPLDYKNPETGSVAIDGLKYDNLGQYSLSLQDVINEGKCVKNSVVLAAKKYTLQKAYKMRKVDGFIRFKVSIIFSNKDVELLSQEYKTRYGPITDMSRFSSPSAALNVKDKDKFFIDNFTKLLQTVTEKEKKLSEGSGFVPGTSRGKSNNRQSPSPSARSATPTNTRTALTRPVSAPTLPKAPSTESMPDEFQSRFGESADRLSKTTSTAPVNRNKDTASEFNVSNTNTQASRPSTAPTLTKSRHTDDLDSTALSINQSYNRNKNAAASSDLHGSMDKIRQNISEINDLDMTAPELDSTLLDSTSASSTRATTSGAIAGKQQDSSSPDAIPRKPNKASMTRSSSIHQQPIPEEGPDEEEEVEMWDQHDDQGMEEFEVIPKGEAEDRIKSVNKLRQSIVDNNGKPLPDGAVPSNPSSPMKSSTNSTAVSAAAGPLITPPAGKSHKDADSVMPSTSLKNDSIMKHYNQNKSDNTADFSQTAATSATEDDVLARLNQFHGSSSGKLNSTDLSTPMRTLALSAAGYSPSDVDDAVASAEKVPRGNAVMAARALKQLVTQQDKVRDVLHDLTVVTEKGFGVLESRLSFLEDAVKASHFFVEGGLHAINTNLDALAKAPPIITTGNATAAGSAVASENKKGAGAGAGEGAGKTAGSNSAQKETEKSISKNDERLAALKEFKQKQKNAKLQKGMEQVGEAIEIIAKLQKGGKVSRHVNNEELPLDSAENAMPNDFNSQGGSSSRQTETEEDDQDFKLGEIGEEETMVLSSPMLPPTMKKKAVSKSGNNASSSYADVLAQQKQQQQLNESQWKNIHQFLGINNYDMAFQIGLNSMNVNAAKKANANEGGHDNFTKLLTVLEPNQVLGNLSSNTVNDLYQGIANILSSSSSSSSMLTAPSATSGVASGERRNSNVKGKDDCMRWLVALTRPRPKSNPNASNKHMMQSKSLSQLSTTTGAGSSHSRLSSSTSPCCQELNPNVIISIINAIDTSYISNNTGDTLTSGQQQQQQQSTGGVNDQKTKAFALLLKSVLTKQLHLQSSQSYSG